jgi:hypothetical protein
MKVIRPNEGANNIKTVKSVIESENRLFYDPKWTHIKLISYSRYRKIGNGKVCPSAQSGL